MTPKKKAQQLIYAFEAFTDRDNEFEFAKQCALIAVDEILFVLNECEDTYSENASQFYNEVKHEIEKL